MIAGFEDAFPALLGNGFRCHRSCSTPLDVPGSNDPWPERKDAPSDNYRDFVAKLRLVS
jgi:hypothetical protein